MNTTQREFALERLFTILSTKLDLILQEQQEQVDEYKKATGIPLKRIQEAKSLLVKEGVYDINDASKLNLEQIYDLTELRETIKKEASHLEPINDNLPELYMYKPNTSERWNCARFKPRFESKEKRAKRVIAAYKTASDEIMLGSNSEALEALKKMEERAF